jgi:CRP-like cAMP-binding protein
MYKENECPDGVYLIDEGEFEIYKKIKDNNITSTFRVSILGSNQIFGLQECINQMKRITS